MSIIPILFRDSFMDDFIRPSIMEKSLFDDEFPANLLVANIPTRRGPKRRRCTCVTENQQNNAVQKKSRESFEVSIDVQNFKPEEISVKMVDNYITVEGKHEEKQDEEGFVSRHFVRKYQLPEGHDLERVASSLSSDGVLTIRAPRLALPEVPAKERSIPIVRTDQLTNGKPADDHVDKEKQSKSHDSQ
ncbi:protein lethal(2)essential for life-like [Culex pipiens pallens]|uniref:protein lethal(2)essential for life-like n=1 Tax=Culex pipiens pallens TaxID=42434 RepID=UPI0019546B9E|nr:protein lethal(2)essential for life-like [Culex pipiens pallens]